MRTVHREPHDLHVAVRKMRWRLGTELLLRLLLYAIGAGLLAASLTRSLAVAFTLGIPGAVVLGTLLLPPLAALAVALLCWPSTIQAARSVDRLFSLRERLSTAVELTEHPEALRRARLAWLQVRDAAQAAAEVSQRWPPLVDRIRRELIVAATFVFLAAVLVALPHLGLSKLGQVFPWGRPAQPVLTERGLVAPDIDTIEQPVSALPESRIDELHALDPAAAQASEQIAAQRRALGRLAQALGEVSVGQAAAQAIQQGDYQTAASELAQLAENLDQLSPEAKQRLATALAQAAQDPSSQGSRLAELERRVAEALTGAQYDAQRRALEELAQELGRMAPSATRAGGDPPDELFEDYLVSGGTEVSGTSGSAEGASGAGGERWQDGRATAGGTEGGSGTGSAGQTAGAPSLESGTVEPGQPSGTQASGGSKRPAMNLGQAAPRLEVSGTPVEVPAQLTLGSSDPIPAGERARPAVSVTSPAAVAPGVSSDAPALTPLAPEQNLVPGDRRRLIQEYFDGEGRESSP